MSDLWEDISYLHGKIRWNEPEVVEHFRDTVKTSIPSHERAALCPRCETCRHWGPFADREGRKECRKTHELDTKVGAAMEELMVAPDFGCVQWEAKS